jgi:hypothetical protein
MEIESIGVEFYAKDIVVGIKEWSLITVYRIT